MDDTISRLAVIQIIEQMRARIGHNLERSVGRAMIEILDEVGEDVGKLPPAQPEPLTDKEQRIFLAAMGRERKVCKEVDDQYTHEPYEILLTKVCNEIERKVKKALWS